MNEAKATSGSVAREGREEGEIPESMVGKGGRQKQRGGRKKRPREKKRCTKYEGKKTKKGTKARRRKRASKCCTVTITSNYNLLLASSLRQGSESVETIKEGSSRVREKRLQEGVLV